MLTLSSEERQLAAQLDPEGSDLGPLRLQTQSWPPRKQGVLISLKIADMVYDLWLMQETWCGWCEGQMGIADTEKIDPLLLASVLEWGLAPLLTACGATMVVPIKPRPCSFYSEQLVVIISWKVEEQYFQATFLSWPKEWWRYLVGHLELSTRRQALAPPIMAALCVGVCHLSLDVLQRIGPRIGIPLHCFGEPQAGEVALILPGGRAIRITWQGENMVKIGGIMRDIEHQRECFPAAEEEGATLSIDALPLTLRVDVGQVEVTLGTLRTLEEGDLVTVNGGFSSFATLRLNGRVIGQGDLISCADTLVVRISRWYLDRPDFEKDRIVI